MYGSGIYQNVKGMYLIFFYKKIDVCKRFERSLFIRKYCTR